MADIMSALCGTDDLFTELKREYLSKRILVLNDEITETIIEDYILYI